MYFCNDCFTEIPDSEIGFNENANVDFCPHCQSRDVEYSGEDEIDDITITSLEIQDPNCRPLTEDEIENGVPVLMDFESFMNQDDTLGVCPFCGGLTEDCDCDQQDNEYDVPLSDDIHETDYDGDVD